MVEHAEQMAKEKERLSEQVKNLTQSQQESVLLTPARQSMSEVTGLMIAMNLIIGVFEDFASAVQSGLAAEGWFAFMTERTTGAMNKISGEIGSRNRSVNSIIGGLSKNSVA